MVSEIIPPWINRWSLLQADPPSLETDLGPEVLQASDDGFPQGSDGRQPFHVLTCVVGSTLAPMVGNLNLYPGLPGFPTG